MNSARRLRVPVLLTAALLALLVFTATATAETRTGESASPFNGGAPSPEATILKGSASYETTGGSVTFSVTTAAEPQVTSEAEIFAALVTARSECSPYAIFLGGTTGPIFTIGSLYEEPTAGAEMESAFGGASEYLGPAAKTVSGTTTTLSFASSKTANQSFNCVFVETFEGGEGGEGEEGEEGGASLLAFPISAPPPPPPAPAPPAPAPPAPAPPAPAPAVLSIAKSKPLKLKADK